MRRIATLAVLATASFGLIAASAGADPVVTACSSIHASVNGQELVGQDNCQVLPPQ